MALPVHTSDVEPHELPTEYWPAPDLRLVPPEQLPTAELAECTCPDFCERDHGNE